MNVSRVVVILSVSASLIAGGLTAHLDTTEEVDPLSLESTDDAFKITCQPPEDVQDAELMWLGAASHGTPRIPTDDGLWHTPENTTHTISHDDAGFIYPGEYRIYAMCKSRTFYESAQWNVTMTRGNVTIER